MDQHQGLSFGAFDLKGANGPLLRDGAEVKLQPKALKVLWTLATQSNQVVTKEALLEAVWPRVVVGDDALSFQIQSLRQVLDDDARRPRFIATVHGIGYRFVADVDVPRLELRRAESLSLVGRRDELAWLDAQLERALRGERRLLFVTGDPGVGKTTLVRTFADAPAAAGAYVGVGQCIEQVGGGEAYLPLLEALARMCRADEKGIVVDVLRRVAPTWLIQMPGLLAPSERDVMQPRLAGATRQRMLREIAEALDAIAVHHPVVLVLEDLHWSDVPTTELLSMLARRLEPAAVMVICTFREVEAVLASHPINPLKLELKARGLAAELALGPLDAASVRGYLRWRLPGASDVLAGAIYRRSEGHALYLVQLADFVAQQGLEAPEDMLDALPSVLIDLIEIQLLKLPPETLEVLEVAAIVPGEFSVASLAAALHQPESVVEHWCERLARQGRVLDERGLAIWPDGTASGRYVFHHSLIQEVLKKRLSGARAVRAQRRMGERKERGWGDRAGEIASELALHFEVAAQPEKEIGYRLTAAKNCRAVAAYEEAQVHAVRGLALLPEAGREVRRELLELELLMVLASIANTRLGYGSREANDMMSRIEELASRDLDARGQVPRREPTQERLTELRTRYKAHLMTCLASMFSGRTLDAIAIADRAIAGVRNSVLADLQCEMLALSGYAHFLRGDMLGADERLALSANLIEAVDSTANVVENYTDPFVSFHLCAAVVSWMGGRGRDAAAHLERALARGRAVGNAHVIGVVLAQIAIHHLLRREPALAEEAALACIDHAIHTGESGWAAVGTKFLQVARCHRGAGDVSVVLQIIDAQRSTGSLVELPLDYALVAAVLSGDDARAVIDAGLAEVEQCGNRAWLPELLRLDGMWLAGNGEHTAGLSRLEEARAVAARQGAVALELRVALSLAELWPCERAEAGRALVASVLERFEPGSDGPDHVLARAILG